MQARAHTPLPGRLLPRPPSSHPGPGHWQGAGWTDRRTPRTWLMREADCRCGAGPRRESSDNHAVCSHAWADHVWPDSVGIRHFVQAPPGKPPKRLWEGVPAGCALCLPVTGALLCLSGHAASAAPQASTPPDYTMAWAEYYRQQVAFYGQTLGQAQAPSQVCSQSPATPGPPRPPLPHPKPSVCA